MLDKPLQEKINDAVKILKEYFPKVEWVVGRQTLGGCTIEGTLGNQFRSTTVCNFYADEMIPHGLEVYRILLMGLGWDIKKKRKENIWTEKNQC